MKRLLFISVSALLLCSSCVSKKKYLLAENGRLEAIGRGDALKEELIKCKGDNDRAQQPDRRLDKGYDHNGA